MNNENHFLCPKKFSKLANKPIDKEVVKSIQLLSDKLLLDIITRSSTLCKHKGKDVIEPEDISFVVEKDFDFTFGVREIVDIKNTPTNEHMERMAEISRQNK